MAVEVEDVDLAFPYGLTVEGLRHGNDLAEASGAAVLGLDGKSKLVFPTHWNRHTEVASFAMCACRCSIDWRPQTEAAATFRVEISALCRK